MTQQGGESLYFFFGTRSMRPEWLAHELGIKLKIEWVELPKQKNKTPEFLAKNPLGAVPVLVDGKVTIIESAAIVQYLADKYKQKVDLTLPANADSAAKAAYFQAIAFATATLDDVILPYLLHTVIFPENFRDPKIPPQKKKAWDSGAAEATERLIGDKKYVIGDKFTIADIVLGYSLDLGSTTGFLKGHPKLEAYINRLKERDAFKKTYDRTSSDYPKP